ncbi:MAG: universal stress protein [Eubacteriaceae bacterium]|nr:universal stress protein [Eubacteriaceae bacterium]
MKKILIPIDGSEYSDRAIEKGKEIAKAFDSSIVIINVVDNIFPVIPFGMTGVANLGPTMDILAKKSDEDSKRLLEEAKEKFGDLKSKVETKSLEGNPALRIVEYAESNNIDLVIMGSEGLGQGLKGVLLGSVTNRVIHGIDLPVLIVK